MAYMGGAFFTSIIGVSLWGWTFGGMLIQNEVINPTTGEKYKLSDIVMVYQAILFGMMTCF